MLLMPVIGLVTFVFAYGLFSLLDGIVAVVASLFGIRGKRVNWGLLLVGLVSLGIGLFFLFRPGLSLALLPFLMRSYALVSRLLLLAAAFRLWRHPNRVVTA